MTNITYLENYDILYQCPSKLNICPDVPVMCGGNKPIWDSLLPRMALYLHIVSITSNICPLSNILF